jgi:hypothetical protein
MTECVEIRREYREAGEPALLKSAGQDGPLLYSGPLCGGEAGSTGRAAGIGRRPMPFRQHMDVLSKSPALAHGLVGQEAQQAPSGVAFLFGYFLFGHAKRK